MIIEVILINLIYILFPIFCYLIYVTYQKTIGKKVNNIFFDLSLLSSVYLVLKYGAFSNNLYNVMILHIILIIAFCRNRKLISIFLSLYLVSYYNQFHSFNLIILILEYGIFMFLYIFKKRSSNYIILSFNLINLIFNFIFILLISDKYKYLYMFYYVLIFAVMSYLIVMLIENSENIIELHSTIKRLEKEKTLRNSLFKITHEIKNPIAVCKGYLDMLDTNNNKQVNKYIPIIKQEINRTLMLMTDFLSLTKLKVNKNILDLTVLLEDTCCALETLSEMNDIDFEYDIPSEEIYIEGDYDRLKQVIINLIKNSIEARKKDSKEKIRLSVEIGDNINIVIEDNGVGMNEEVLKRVGESFFTTKNNGTGLGVKLSKEIIEAHDGEIIYDSKEGEYTIVTVTLPKKR